MKEWNNPQLLSLGVENTFTEDEASPVDSESSWHYCHRLGYGVKNSQVTGSEHNPANGCHLKDAEGHEWNGMKLSKCCCTEPTSAS